MKTLNSNTKEKNLKPFNKMKIQKGKADNTEHCPQLKNILGNTVKIACVSEKNENDENYKTENKKAWKMWVQKENIELQKSVNTVALKVGDKVDFVNDYGVLFQDFEVLGFAKNIVNERCVYLNSNAYWFAVKFENLIIKK